MRLFRDFKLKHQLFFVVDIIWNHCSVDAEWILEEPGCYYSPTSHPPLVAAFELDKALTALSCGFEGKGVTESGQVQTSDDVDRVIAHIRTEVFGTLMLHEYFQVNIEESVQQLPTQSKKVGEDLQRVIKNGSSEFIFVDSDEVELFKSHLVNLGCGRYLGQVDPVWLTDYLTNKRQSTLVEFEYRKLLKQINLQLQQTCREWEEEALGNLRKEIIERFLAAHVSKVTPDYPLVQRYFHQLPNDDFAMFNGVVRGTGKLEDMTMDQQQWYLRRAVQVWPDSIKLNYQTPEECPKLWARMNEYTQKMAVIFDGFRLNNFHSTNIETAKIFINNAIRVNESLFLFSELFSTSPKIDVSFCLRVGVHRLVRELQSCSSLGDVMTLLGDHLSEANNFATQIPALCINNYEITYLKASKPLPIICDSTYENQAYFQKHNIYVQLPLLALENMVSLMTGTLRGFDELFTRSIPNTCTKKYPRLEAQVTIEPPTDEDTWFIMPPGLLGELIRSSGRGHLVRRPLRVVRPVGLPPPDDARRQRLLVGSTPAAARHPRVQVPSQRRGVDLLARLALSPRRLRQPQQLHPRGVPRGRPRKLGPFNRSKSAVFSGNCTKNWAKVTKKSTSSTWRRTSA
jgi:glycogen debranching enzyme